MGGQGSIREIRPQQVRADTIDLETDTSLMVDISDALSEQEKVKFTVHTKVYIVHGSGGEERRGCYI